MFFICFYSWNSERFSLKRLMLLLITAVFSCFSIGETRSENVTDASISEDLPINYIQTIGTHNSYHLAPFSQLTHLFKEFDYLHNNAAVIKFFHDFDYSHKHLAQQLSLGVRQLELDVYDDPHGGKFSHFSAYPILFKKNWLKESQHHDIKNSLLEKGMKIFHLPESDFRSNCLLLKDCLTQIKQWSDVHKDHLPIFLHIEVKENSVPIITDPDKAIAVNQFNRDTWDRLENEILSIFPKERLITPDVVRGDFNTLMESVQHRGWPKLEESRGKIMFYLDNRGETMKSYLGNALNLKNRLLFVSAQPGDPAAGWLIKNNPFDSEIPLLVTQGYMVRTRADANTVQSRNFDYNQMNAAFASGAQIISTDYPEPDKRFSNYQVKFPNGNYTRIRPNLQQSK